MAERRRRMPWILGSLAIATAALALGSGAILRAIERTLEPPPSKIIIVAPTGSEKV